MSKHEDMSRRGQFIRFLSDNAVPLALAGIAFGGSFDHWKNLAASHGQRGILAPAVAVCVDLGVYMAARERQRDLKIGRKRRGWTSWPTLVMTGGIALTLAGNVAGAQPTAWGVITAVIPGMFLLLAISLMERRAAEDGRRHLAAEELRQRQEAAERQRQEAERAERERQEQKERQAAERQARLAERRDRIVTLPPGSVTSMPPRLALANGKAHAGSDGGKVSATDVMRAFWDQQVAAGRVPSGADLMRAAGLDPASSSLGRQNAIKWKREMADPGDDDSDEEAAAV